MKIRFTPTCVGKMCPVHMQPILRAVHPHVRGENSSDTHVAIPRPGSPPRAWGKLAKHVLFKPGPRFTPTCVGKINYTSAYFAVCTVHPHVRGENIISIQSTSFECGSPPRAWGKWTLFIGHRIQHRFTPTCVGKIRRPL